MDRKELVFMQEPLENVYEVGEEIGSGQFAVVKRCRHKVTGTEFAAKFIRKRRAIASRRGAPIEDIRREVAILSELSHDSIVKLYEVYENSQHVVLILELVSGGELFDYLADREKVSEKEATIFLHQILKGICHLHEKKIVHLDLKPENLMLVTRNSYHLKIIDFGLSQKLEDNVECRRILGTAEFVAPEVVNFDPLCLATDMWSVGVIAYLLIGGCSPFLGRDKLETLSHVSAVNYSFDEEHFCDTSDLAKDFIEQLLVRDPRKRATVYDCLNHPWLTTMKVAMDLNSLTYDDMVYNLLESKQSSKSCETLVENGLASDDHLRVALVVTDCEMVSEQLSVDFLSRQPLASSQSTEQFYDIVEDQSANKALDVNCKPSHVTDDVPQPLVVVESVSNCSAEILSHQQQQQQHAASETSSVVSECNESDVSIEQSSANLASQCSADDNTLADISESSSHVIDASSHAVVLSNRPVRNVSTNCDTASHINDGDRTTNGNAARYSVVVSSNEHPLHFATSVNGISRRRAVISGKNVVRLVINGTVSNVSADEKAAANSCHVVNGHGTVRNVKPNEKASAAPSNCHVVNGHGTVPNVKTNEKASTAGNSFRVVNGHGTGCILPNGIPAQNGKSDQLLNGTTNHHHIIEQKKVTAGMNGNKSILDMNGSLSPDHLQSNSLPSTTNPFNVTQMDVNVVDENGNTPLHHAVDECHLDVIRYLLGTGANVNAQNKVGNTALHLAVQNGNTEIVRQLMLCGARTDIRNVDGRNAEIAAIRCGYVDIVDIVTRVKRDRRIMFAKQLEPGSSPLSRIKLKVFGDCAVGKTSLIESLKCSYFGSLLRSAFRSSANDVNHVPVYIDEYQNGMKPSAVGSREGTHQHTGCTRGVSVEQVTINGIGDTSIWEFSGCESYFVTYDHFIGDVNCVHVITINMQDSVDTQLNQLIFWLNFIKARIALQSNIGFGGKLMNPPKVIVVATHASNMSVLPCERCSDCNHACLLIETITQKFDGDFEIYPHLFAIDTHRTSSPELKGLRQCISDLKTAICHNLPPSNGLLETVTSMLPSWRRQYAPYPVLTWPRFAERVRSGVNLLCGIEHLHNLVCQLQLSGEVVYIESADGGDDLVVLNPRWLCTDIIGKLLSPEHVTHCRPTGRFSIDEVSLWFPESNISKVTELLKTLELCSAVVEDDEDVEYEFMCLNLIEMDECFLDYEEDVRCSWAFGGTRLVGARGVGLHLTCVFPRIQSRLRRRHTCISGLNCELQQSYGCCRLSYGQMQVVISASIDNHAIDIRCRGPSMDRSGLFRFHSAIVELIIRALSDFLPGVTVERQLLSSSELMSGELHPRAYTACDIRTALLNNDCFLSSPVADFLTEDLTNLAAFGSAAVFSKLKSGTTLPVSMGLSIPARRSLAKLLDPPDATGHDWCLLAVLLGITDSSLEQIDTNCSKMSPTDHCLAVWAGRDGNSATISALMEKFNCLSRQDAVDALLAAVPLFATDENCPTYDKNISLSHDSDLTVSSSVSR